MKPFLDLMVTPSQRFLVSLSTPTFIRLERHKTGRSPWPIIALLLVDGADHLREQGRALLCTFVCIRFREGTLMPRIE